MKKGLIRGGIVLAISGIALLLVLFPPPFLKVQEIQILTPLHHLSEMDLIRLSGVQKGQNILTLRLSKIRGQILRYPWIKEVRLSKKIPGRVMIAVEEQVPFALLELESLYLINAEGVVFKKLEPGDPRDLPIITGLSQGEIRSSIQLLLHLIQDFEKSPQLDSVAISEIHLNDAKELSLFTKDPVIHIELGKNDSEQNWKQKLSQLGSAWKTIRSTTKKMKFVDLNLKKRIVVQQEID
ncbi:MAG: FtsQ-type POTRA domain-containing protein [Deltaproteobacteria bacterium]|nr:FtsQ-type POTRA domain-containing protein [Deltaproteobacteria bacterium]